MAKTTIPGGYIEAGSIDTASLADTSITADKLHTTLDLTGKTITVATATAGDNDTTVASTAFVSTAIATKLPLAGGTMTGTIAGFTSTGIDDNATSTAITIDSSENVGIGTAEPHVNSKVTIERSSNQLRLTDGSLAYDIGYDNSYLRFKNSAGDTHAVINWSSGNVGIGESSPVAKVHIQGSGTSGQVTSSLILENSSSGTAGLQITGAAGSSHLDFMYGGGPSTGTNTLTTGMTMTLEGSGAGNVGIGAAPETAPYYNNDDPVLTVQKASGNAILPIVAAANTSSAILHLNQSGNRYWRMSAIYGGSLTFGGKQPGSGAAESEAMRITSTGRVGIGTDNPSEILHINAGGSGPEIRLQNQNSSHYIRAYNDNWNFYANSANTAIAIKNSGIVTKPNHPAFHAYGGSLATQTTEGNYGTWTESFDRSGDYVGGTTNVFTAPVDGIYAFYAHSNFNTASTTPYYWRAIKNSSQIGIFYGSGASQGWDHVMAFMTVLLDTNDTFQWYYRGDPDEGLEWAQLGGYLIG